ncbi:hypothetical protein FO675_06170 [Riemerella anatipestifer]|uniref:hypothetical protein n=1 Tax=Riemerella anatipestifer TaxID=34085 RepID=UPI001AD73110|nr:hypothetical protein [Riemerella anatipestifer]MBO4233888.1 hypothetical protein [Riemerella anatipestifer]
MTDFFSKIILDLQERISAEVPEIRYIDQNLGQLGQISDEDSPPLSYPAVLIDFPDTSFSNLSSNIQLGNASISFVLVFETHSQTWHQSPKDIRINGLSYLTIEQKLHKALQGFASDYFAPLSRKSVRSQNNNDVGLRVRELTYSTEFEDWSLDDATSTEFEIVFNGSLKAN